MSAEKSSPRANSLGPSRSTLNSRSASRIASPKPVPSPSNTNNPPSRNFEGTVDTSAPTGSAIFASSTDFHSSIASALTGANPTRHDTFMSAQHAAQSPTKVLSPLVSSPKTPHQLEEAGEVEPDFRGVGAPEYKGSVPKPSSSTSTSDREIPFSGGENREGHKDNETKKSPPKRLILCFDGTGNKFGDTVRADILNLFSLTCIQNSNVVRFFEALKKDDPDNQLCYYQPGVGTYTRRQFYTPFFSMAYQKIEEALARELNDHVKEGYEFIMRNYYPGDQIFLFGFSRGAYTARALSGMIYKVGLLPRHNDRQIDFAFTVYNTYDKKGAALARKFKKTFAMDVPIRFVGVWDTVSSVGIIPTTLPFSTYNDGVEVFRHALALDERRARFRPCLWGEPRPTREILDNDPKINRRVDTARDEWNFEPMSITDVKEVWFVGCHADVGGGSHADDDQDDSLSNITLRWMIMECFRAETDIVFEEDELLALGFKAGITNQIFDWKEWDSAKAASESLTDTGHKGSQPAHSKVDMILSDFQRSHLQQETGPVQSEMNRPPTIPRSFEPDLPPWVRKDNHDSLAQIYDQFMTTFGKFWWAIELVPTMILFRTQVGWWVTRERNRGRGRYLPVGEEKIRIHISVLQRMEEERKARQKFQAKQEKTGRGDQQGDDRKVAEKKTEGEMNPLAEVPYQPKARNWQDIFADSEDDRILWVY